jgi:hypothetical protein
MSRSKSRSAFGAILLAGFCAAPAAASPASSWGKAGVSFEEYRADATNCLREAAATDLSGSEPARALVLATRRIEAGLTRDLTPIVNGGAGLAPATARPAFDPFDQAAQRVGLARSLARVDLRMRQAREILQARLEQCLAGRGYRHFRLTEAQRRMLDRFPARAPERQAYLHRLASDPQILATQSE